MDVGRQSGSQNIEQWLLSATTRVDLEDFSHIELVATHGRIQSDHIGLDQIGDLDVVSSSKQPISDDPREVRVLRQ